MIREVHVCLVLGGLAVAILPATAQEAVLQLPVRNPVRAMPAVKTAEALLPNRNPSANDRAGPRTPGVPSPVRNPGLEDTYENAAPPERNPVWTPERVLPWERNSISGASPESAPPPDRNPVSADTPESAPPPEQHPHSTKMPEAATADGSASEGETVVSAPDDAPLPDRKPPPGDRPTVAWKNPSVVAARERCATLLEGRHIEYETIQPIRRGACGAPAPILVKSVGTNPAVRIEPPATMRCPLAAALETWFRDQVQPAAAAAFKSPVVKIRNISSYKCRNRYNAANTKISEHAFANALDVSAFVLGSGDTVTVLNNWRRPPPLPPLPPLPDPKPMPPSAEMPITKVTTRPPSLPTSAPKSLAQRKSEFLRGIHADGCKTFNTVLGPAANAAHRNHFHLDMKVRRYVKICE
jgi:hypothetical protein